MDVEQRLRLVIPRREIGVGHRPGGRHAAGVGHLLEVAFAQAKQRGTIDLGVAAHIVVELRREGAAVLVHPLLVGLIPALHEHRLGTPIRFLARQILAAFQHQDALAGGRQALRQCRAARPAADHDQVVVIVFSH